MSPDASEEDPLEAVRAQLARALDGDVDAIRWLVELLSPVVQARVARALLRRAHRAQGRATRQEVEDLTQEVFVALFADGARALRAWDPDRGLSLENFVGLIAERQVASILRSGRRSPWTEEPVEDEALDGATPPSLSPERIVGSHELLSSLLERMRERLSPLGLFLFERLYVDQREVAEVCDETGLSRDAVYAWRSRLGKLARALAADLLSDDASPSRRPKTGVPA